MAVKGQAAQTTLSAPSVCIIEDDAHFRETFADVMALRGIRVQGAATAQEGLLALSRQKPSVVIIDIRLPDMHGFELCRRVKRLPGMQKVPVILISASTRYSDPADQAEMFLAGASAFLPKPLTIDDLWAEIEAVLRKNNAS